MFIAIGFPSSAREEGMVPLYVGLDKGAMLKACDAGAKSGKYQRISKLINPLMQKHSMQAPVDVKFDCSPEAHKKRRAAFDAAAKAAAEKEASEKAAKEAAAKAALEKPPAELEVKK